MSLATRVRHIIFIPPVDEIFTVFMRASFFSVALRPDVGHGLLILEVSRSHTTTHHSR